MSFGFSPGDLVMLINGFYRLTGILRNSPGQYQNLLGTFNNFCILSKRLDLIPSAGQASDEALKGLQQQTYDVLKTFFSRIKKFDRYLGKGQDPFALRNVVHKINWASQVGDLNDLLKDLERLVIFINVHLTIDMRRSTNSFFKDGRSTNVAHSPLSKENT
ncbi:hypothetical protein N7522_001420 [Penicillium canescens]|nr:hypothetical protein N7522_001420 [Penicillium canescens]